MHKLVKTLALLILTAASAALSAAPVGYSINSDSGSNDSDGLYRIDLETGQELERIGTVQTTTLQTFLDVEGLAFSANGQLFGIDDEQLKLFPIDLDNSAFVDPNETISISGLTAQNNDFGMTFACDNNLYVSSIKEGYLYRVSSSGAASAVGPLGVNISALAANGDELFGLSNGTEGVGANGPPKLYKINMETGAATEIGPLGAVAPYTEGGLAFDENGELWAITDRATQLLGSQVLKLDLTTGAATVVSNTNVQGFESLAITSPRGCAPTGNGDYASFIVQTRFVDQNNITPVTLNIQCNDGFWGDSSRTLAAEEDSYGRYQYRFIVEDFIDGALNCEIWEDSPAGYTPEYDCQIDSACSSNAGTGPCSFDGIGIDQEEVCIIENRVSPVDVTVTKEWLYQREDLIIDDSAIIELYCASIFDGDGERVQTGLMRWSWLFDGSPASQVATINPSFKNNSQCWTEEPTVASAVETESSCADPVLIPLGDAGKTCTVYNTVFFEGIPTLSQYGLLLISALMLVTGLIAVRRAG
ncbi:MAG: IPTL-CTERM sorting domain-containing protein [Xanthomonadales bacterium]|nr:IPTL-CTERM sorting domain-containing protein [Gammaproteobacteria bacterium]MBT8053471.1 IPTL-CTERM sorting domain-containing protein [Gammaproteobacteria bacterium]NND55839.1 IPTL-CTERM sorting domain-containing protein [Xanthomonadales bacterium]NNK50941.1 IPTL-CTERM sorting domain-containing protein [Xanthomonadales bacterium]